MTKLQINGRNMMVSSETIYTLDDNVKARPKGKRVWHMKKLILTLIFLLLPVLAPAADNQLALRGGFHWWESGHTFSSSSKVDEYFDGPCWELEYTRWWDKFGVAINGGKNRKVNEVMYKPDWRYKAEIQTAELIPQFKVYSGWHSDVRFGLGVSYSKLINSYGNQQTETFRQLGWLILLGTDLFLKNDSSWFLTFNAKYIRNDVKSDYYSATYFRIGGLRMMVGLGYQW